MRARSAQLTVAALACITAGSGCGSGANISNAWRDPAFTGPPVKNMLVLAMKRDPVRRRIWEDAMAAELARHGVAATPAYRLFPDNVPDTTAIATAVKDDAIESVMVVKKLANQESTRYVPGYVSTEPVTRYNPWTRAYETWYRDVQHAGYTETEKTVRHEIALWLTRGSAQLAWIGVGEVIDPNSPEAVRKEVVDLVVPELVQQHLIPPK